MQSQFYVVIWNDDFGDNGGSGYQEFENIDNATDFITKRIGAKDASRERKLDDYILLEGKKLLLKAESVVTRIRVG